MGFDSILTAPLFAPGASGDLFLAGDHECAHAVMGTSLPADQAVAELAEACRRENLQLFMDVLLGRIAPDAKLAASSPEWFQDVAPAQQRVHPRSSLTVADAAYARFDDPAAALLLAEWWIERLRRLIGAGAGGFRLPRATFAPAPIWRQIISAVRRSFPGCRFLAWTPGLTWKQITELRDCGFDAAFSSIAWWDGHAHPGSSKSSNCCVE